MLLVVTAAACGGGSSPAAPASPVSSPSPTPTPAVTINLNAHSDHYQFSRSLAEISAGQTFDIAVTPERINEVAGETYGHAVEFWLLEASSTVIADFADDGYALSLVWADGADWAISSRIPGEGYRFRRRYVSMNLGDEHVVRIARARSDHAEFLFDGRGVLTLFGPTPTTNVFARVVGTGAEFSYIPQGSSAFGAIAATAEFGPQDCGVCVSTIRR